MTAKELYKIFDERKWIDETIDLINPDGVCMTKMNEDEATVDEAFDKAKQRIQELEEQVRSLQEQMTTKQPKISFPAPSATPKKIKMKKEESSAVSLDDIVELMDVF